VAWRERCPRCKSFNITGRAFDAHDGDEAQERYCYDCKHFEERLRSQGGVSWYVRAPTQEPHRMHAAEGIERTLLDQIRAAPDDDAPRSIYADWLIEHGDPLGTFIALQLARAQKRDPDVSAEEQQLVDAHWSAWIGAPSAMFEANEVAFERGFWSMARTTSRSQYTFLAQHVPPLPIEDLRMWFDISRDPPALYAPGLAHVRRVTLSCLPQFATRWIGRAYRARQIDELALVSSMNAPEVREVIRDARTTRLVRFAIVLQKLSLWVVRDTDGSFLVRTIVLDEPVLHDVKRWLQDLEGFVDPGVKLVMREIEPQTAEVASRMGMKLVRGAVRFAAAPKA
jgi:uncharacterized protein (TIGR02996 family)